MELSQAREVTRDSRERQRESREAILARQAIEKAKFWSDLAEMSDELKSNVNQAVEANSSEGLDFAAVVHEVKLPDDPDNEMLFSMVTGITDAVTDHVKSDVERDGVNVQLARETTTGDEDDPRDYYKSVFALTWPER